MENKWVDVQYSKKKPGNKLTKAEKHQFAQNMPVLNQHDPRIAMKTGSVAYLETDYHEPASQPTPSEQKDPANKGKTSPGGKGAGKPAGAGKAPGKPNGTASGSKKTALQLLNELDGEELRKVYDDLSRASNNNQFLCLVDFAAHISRKFDPDGASTANFDADFPMCYLKASTRKALNGILVQVPQKTLSAFVATTLETIVEEMQKGVQNLGSRLLVQIILRLYPHLVVDSATKALYPQFLQLLRFNHQNTALFLAISWGLNQASMANFRIGCRVVMEALLPYLHVRNLGDEVLKWAERVMDLPSKDASSSVDAKDLTYKDFIPMLDLVFQTVQTKDSTSRAATSAPSSDRVMKRLGQLYPKVKKYGFVNQSDSSLKDYFPSLLQRLTLDTKQSLLNAELYECLTHCLVASPSCWKVWSQTHQKYRTQTSLLLRHLIKTWKTVKHRADGPSVRTALTQMCRDLAECKQGSVEAEIVCNAQILIQSVGAASTVVRAASRACRITVLLLLCLAGAVVAADLVILKDQSVTRRFLNRPETQAALQYIGGKLALIYRTVEELALRLWSAAAPYLSTAAQWSQNRLTAAWEAVRPTLIAWKIPARIEAAAIITLDKGAEYADWIADQLADLAAWVASWHWCCVWSGLEQLGSWYRSAVDKVAATWGS